MALLADNPLLLLFLIAALGALLGSVRVRGFSLGVSAVLFVGLGLNAAVPRLTLPVVFLELGLALFVYTIGVASGPGFFASMRARGARDAATALAAVAAGAAVAFVAHVVLDLEAPLAAGLFAGALTNTPALAAVLRQTTGSATAADPAVAYSVAYPFGVIGLLLAMHVAVRLTRGTAGSERTHATQDAALVSRTVRLTAPSVSGETAEALRARFGTGVVFGRHRHADRTTVVTDRTVLSIGDLITVVGAPDRVAEMTAALGEEVDTALELDRSELDVRRVFVSSRDTAGRRLRDVEGELRRFGAHVTRIRRGDVDLIAEGSMVLLPGDRVRVIAPRERMAEVSRFFGDSYRAVGEIDVVTVGLGICCGIALGSIEIPVPGGTSFSLGLAGGPLVAGLVLGRIGRLGPLVWAMPYGANVTLRQLGLLLFFAVVGTRTGAAFVHTAGSSQGITLLVGGAAITLASAATVLLAGRFLLRLPLGTLLGMTAGAHTQPAALDFADAHTGPEQARAGYVAAFPIATIAKVVIAQLLLSLLGRAG